MPMAYKIIDNALAKSDYELIKNLMLSADFPWFYSSFVKEKDEKVDNFYFVHLFYSETSWNSQYATQIMNPILSVLNPRALMRVKGNLYPRTESFQRNESHIDYEFSHMGAIYYVNSNDGFTVLEDGTEIESVANRILIFDPSLPHYSTHCTDEKVRVNINFNFF